MKSTITSLLALLLLATVVRAQPSVSYMIPDIGAPGMNTYVEIVAPVGAAFTFGNPDQMYLNTGAEAVSVQPNVAADNNRVVIGPVVVSWSGRLISTQIFVKPGAALGVVPLKITVGGNSTVINDFSIVNPQVLGVAGTITGGGALGSGGVFGTRSKRGAMIVSSLFLKGGNFTIDTNDVDAGAAGNQGFLPFILISKGSLAINSDARLSANGATSYAGPGGGGGGGRVCDATFFNPNPIGADGGSGFTGGGGGGRNNGASSVERDPGSGTGAQGLFNAKKISFSMNGVRGGASSYVCGNPESAGGGTGHPFGLGGDGTCGTTTPPGGQYGGGSGNLDNGTGSGGGYGTNGVNGSGATNGGNVHGNRMGVPVAGGSGGGSSNPKFVAGGCGSAGGGGGGALALFSMDVLNGNIVEAIGGNAESVTPVGGSGSGGYVELGAKVQKSFGGTGNVSGGTTGSAGGRGRARYDGGFITAAPTFGAATPFIGPTIDTLTYIQSKTFVLSGTYGGAATEPVQLYMRGDVGNWTLVPGVTFTGRTWSVNVTVTGGKGNYYFAALQTVAAPSSAAYLNEPSYVLSQAAANIVVVDLIPKINVDRTTLTFRDIVCEPNMIDSVKIWNSGDDTLKITPTFANGATADFTLLQPIPPIAPNDTVWAHVRFAPTTPGTKSVDFVLNNNDPRPGKNPTIIRLTGRKLNFQPSLAKTSLDLGDVCMDSTTSLSFNFNYTGDIPDTIVAITRLGTGPAAFTITGPTIPANGLIFLNPTSSGTIVVQFRPPSVGIFVDSFRVLTKPCNLPLTFTVRGRGYANSIQVTPDPLDFGQVRVGQTATTPGFTVKNTGTLDGTITDAYITPAGSPFVVAPSLNGTLVPAGGSVPGTVSFKPLSSGPFNAQLCVVFGTTCRDTVCVALKGEGVTSLLVLSRKKITLSADSCADVPPSVTDTFKLYNRGTAAVQIDAATAVNGLAMLSPSKPIPGSLAAGDSILFTVTWSPGGAGAEQFKILTQAEDPSQQVMLVDATLRRERGGIDLLKGDGSPLPSTIDLGNIFDCTTGGKNYQLSIRNTGTLAENVTASFVAGGIFSLSPTSPYAIPTGGREDITLGFNSGATGDFTDTLLIREGVCGKETRIPVTGHRYSVSVAATGIAFGNSNVGVAKSGTATAQNTSDPKTPNNVKVNIAGVFITQSGNEFAIVQPTGLPKGLATNEAATVDVTFTPSGQTSYSAQICFYTDSPCPDTICKSLTGTGIMSSIVVRQSSVNFGTRYICQDSVTTISIRNSGSATLNVLGLDIGGVDAPAFQELTGLTFPVMIPPADSIMIKLRFNPAGASGDGLKNGTLTIRSDDAAQPSIVVSLIGERRKQALSTPNQLDFGRVDVGTTVLDTLTLENRTSAPMRIESFTLGAPFVIVSPLGALTIAPFDSVRVVVRFAPADSNAAASTLVGIASSPCADTTRVPVTGRGRIQQIGIATIIIPDSLRAKAGDRISIPLLLSSGSNLKESQATTFSATVRFNASMLLPLGVRGRGEPLLKGSVISVGSITSSKVVGTERVVTFQITNSQLPTAPDTLGFLDARVALGDSIITPITIDTLFWTDGKVNTTTRDGSFTLDGYCVAGGTRLFRLTGGFGIKAAVPNPFNPATVITFETAELGPTSLAIYDLYGGLVETLVDRRSMPIGAFDAVWHAETYSSGVYYAVLTSPTQRSIQQLVLVK